MILDWPWLLLPAAGPSFQQAAWGIPPARFDSRRSLEWKGNILVVFDVLY